MNLKKDVEFTTITLEARLNALETEVDTLTERLAKLENRFITKFPAGSAATSRWPA